MKYKNLDIDFDSFNFFKEKNFSLSDISNHLNKKNLSINKSLLWFLVLDQHLILKLLF